MKKTTILAIFVTFFWLAGVTTLVCLKWASFNSLTPNEWGDFLANSVAFPLALTWLVAGYLQQGKELRINIRALKEQQRELERRVMATNEVIIRSETPVQTSASLTQMANVGMQERAV